MTDNKWIMLVEDNEGDQELTRRALKKNNILNKLVIVEDGQEALDYLFGTGEYQGHDLDTMPTVILLDLKLPKVDGLEVLRRLREKEKTAFIPVVILTSSKEESDVINGYRSKCNSYIRKPVDFVQFAEAMKNLGMYWLLLNETPYK